MLEGVASAAARLGSALASVAVHPAVAKVRRQGLMTGVELAPPPGAVRWGRKVCAAAVRAGVLLRPLGDVVVVMPPLTVTEAEIDMIVAALINALDEVAAEPSEAVSGR